MQEDIVFIQLAVCTELRVRHADILRRKRGQHIDFCREAAMYLAREITGASYPTLGKAFGRDHSSVICAHRVIKKRLDAEAGNKTGGRPFAWLLNRIKASIENEREFARLVDSAVAA